MAEVEKSTLLMALSNGLSKGQICATYFKGHL